MVDRSGYETVTTLDALDRWIAEATALGHVAIDTETDCIDCVIARLVGHQPGDCAQQGLLHPRRPFRRATFIPTRPTNCPRTKCSNG